MNLADIRLTYAQREPTEAAADPDALRQFQVWLDEAIAARVDEPTAMVLATVAPDGRPTARVVLLKALDLAGEGGLTFFTNYESAKGQALAHEPRAALTFFWPALERQVRVEGVIREAPAAQSDTYFVSRPRGSQLGAWASPQSEPVPDRAFLEGREQDMGRAFAQQDPLPRPPHWGGYTLRPTRIEFWQGRPSRLHDRLVYERASGVGQWQMTRLAP
ncbi:MAG: pyridoxamine 5'-phosphate oxidase [Hymenobacteraceae bacterium]|nr:pyridoxamine 5'-phosphate oxidase [Hymenobacteraceae bacterium]